MNINNYLKKCGLSQSEFAKKIGVTQGFISHILVGRNRIPAEKVIPIEKATNGAVTRYELRPDIYPPEKQDTAKAVNE